MDFISNVGIIICFHCIFIQPIPIEGNFMDNYFFFLWEISCLLKVFRVSEIFMQLINYKIIIQTITDVYPLIRDLLILLFVVLLFGSSFFMSIFGGKMNSNYENGFTKLITSGYGDNSNLNFNDVASSLLKISLLVFTSYDDLFPDISYLGY